jgi:hypothetical protein
MSMSFILQNYMADKDSIIDELNRKLRDSVNLHDVCIQLELGVKVFNATFNNISVILTFELPFLVRIWCKVEIH